MSKNKNQHYVPQFYLRNFSINEKSINVFNLTCGEIIIGDSIKNQCSEDYFYGKTIPIEKTYNEIESYSGILLKKIRDDNFIPKFKTQDHSILQLFIVTLYSRTKYKAEEQNEIIDKLGKSILALDPNVDKDLLNKVELKLDFPLHYSILYSLTKYHLAQDLSIHLLLNGTQTNFITSDHPVIYYNKWTEDVKDYGAVGLASKGLMIFLPISPQKVLLLYDKSVYKVGDKKTSITILIDQKEINNINLMQWLKCRDNIYFYSEDDQIKIKKTYQVNSRFREKSKVKIQERLYLGNSKIIGAHSSKLNMKLEINSIKIRKQAKQYKTNEKILAIRNPKLFELVNEFSEQIKLKKYSSMEWNRFLEDKIIKF